MKVNVRILCGQMALVDKAAAKTSGRENEYLNGLIHLLSYCIATLESKGIVLLEKQEES